MKNRYWIPVTLGTVVALLFTTITSIKKVNADVKQYVKTGIEQVISDEKATWVAPEVMGAETFTYSGDIVRYYETVQPTETPIATATVTPIPLTNFQQNLVTLGLSITDVFETDLEKLVEEIEQDNYLNHPEYRSLVDQELNESRINFIIDANRGTCPTTGEHRYSSDLFLMVSYHLKTGKYDLINIPRELHITEMPGARQLNYASVLEPEGYNEQDYYMTIARITGLMPHAQLHIGTSQIFVNYIDNILEGIDVTINDTVNDSLLGIYLEEGNTYNLDAYAAVYAAVSRHFDLTGSRMTRQMDVFVAMQEKMLEVYPENPMKLLETIAILDYYMNETDVMGDPLFGIRTTNDSEYFGKGELLSLALSLGTRFLEDYPELHSTVNVFFDVPEVRNNNLVDEDGEITFMKSPFPTGFIRDWSQPDPNLPDYRDPILPYYVPIRSVVKETVLQ